MLLNRIMNRLFQSAQTQNINPVKSYQDSNNFFKSGNNSLFINNEASYGKNERVPGGLYYGEYNGKPNIVASRLFVIA